MKHYICGLILVLLWLASPAQTLDYGIFWGDDRIGQMQVTRTQTAAGERLRSAAEMTIKVMVKVDLAFFYESDFEDGTLVRSLTRNLRNGTERDRSEGQRVGSSYVVEREGTTYRSPAAEVDYTILRAYFEAPGTRRRVFSERWGRWLDYLPEGEGRYAMHLPNGDVNYLTYREGRCAEIELSHLFATIIFRLED